MNEQGRTSETLKKPTFLRRAFDSAAALGVAGVSVPAALLPHALIGGYDGAIFSGLLLGVAFNAVTAMAYRSSFKSYKDSYLHISNKSVDSCAAAVSMCGLMYFG